MRIQANIAGYGETITLVGVLDDETGVLVVMKKVPYSEKRLKDDFALVTNADLPEYDFRFTDEHIGPAIRSYFNRSSQGSIDISDELARYRPDNRIEKDKVDERGPSYRISPEIDGGQFAILAMTAFVDCQQGIATAMGAMDEMAELYDVVTI